MIWMLFGAGLQSASDTAFYYDTMDGDLDKVTLQDMSVDIGKWPLNRTDFFSSGRKIVPDHLPTRIRPKRDRGGSAPRKGQIELPDYAKVAMAQIVSQKFRDVVEAHDPATHQFFPVTLQWASGEEVAMPYYWFIPAVRLFAMDPDRTSPVMTPYPTGPDWISPHKDKPALQFDITADPKVWAPAFYAQAVGSHDVFCAGEMSGYIFITDRLKNALEADGVRGWTASGPFELSN